jgi:hypothetical protein
MPQISIYIEKTLYMEVRSKAEELGVPFSNYVSTVLRKHIDNSWPEGYFEKFVGIFKDDPMEIPEDLPWSLDSKREIL